jgi:hypothetical protein
MKLSIVFAAILAASADAAAFEKRQRGNPDGTLDQLHPQMYPTYAIPSQRLWPGCLRGPHHRGSALLQQHPEVRNRHINRHERRNDNSHHHQAGHYHCDAEQASHSNTHADTHANSNADSEADSDAYPISHSAHFHHQAFLNDRHRSLTVRLESANKYGGKSN